MSQTTILIDQLQRVWQTMQLRWSEVRSEWRDSQAHYFEERFWQELAVQMERFLHLARQVDGELRELERNR